ncbi:Mitochondrial carrier [Venustampulla echinocandica]|uniref:Mitochondrial carrier n=1 Tax=Venustampulla echinocandica TaxID=2656787 RepID=A0A370TLR7_9HELO|nr:Mitochondrial carrier [Venustampulla echinocandica]RDL36473.1 Mitochondrial carrier [Venustampulla echinocandica]
MATSRDGTNPLRPYYRPPSIGIPLDAPATSSGTHGLGPKNGSAAAYASSARDMFDYSDYLSDSSPSSIDAVKRTLDDWLYRYISILLAQPFDVAKMVLQVRSQTGTDGTIPRSVTGDRRSQNPGYRDSIYRDYISDDSDGDEQSYFTSSSPSSLSHSPSRSRRHNPVGRDYSPSPERRAAPGYQLSLKKADSILEVISQEWTKEGARGVWKASNTTFLYSLLLHTMEQWSRGLFSAIFNMPEAAVAGLTGSADLADSPYPWASLGVAVAAAVTTGLILAPLDLVRTKSVASLLPFALVATNLSRLILTPTSSPKRSLAQNLRSLPSYFCSSTLMIPTMLHSLITPTINHSTPLLLRSHLAIDPVLTPTAYSIANLLSRTVELFLKLPLETVLRRGQISVLMSPSYCLEIGKQLETTVEPGPYSGVLGTMWSIVKEEGGPSGQEKDVGIAGIRSLKKGKKAEKKGQGVEGLWRGWRVGMWGLVGMWGARAMGGSGSSAGEF